MYREVVADLLASWFSRVNDQDFSRREFTQQCLDGCEIAINRNKDDTIESGANVLNSNA